MTSLFSQTRHYMQQNYCLTTDSVRPLRFALITELSCRRLVESNIEVRNRPVGAVGTEVPGIVTLTPSEYSHGISWIANAGALVIS